jgi:hypothetical protein
MYFPKNRKIGKTYLYKIINTFIDIKDDALAFARATVLVSFKNTLSFGLHKKDKFLKRCSLIHFHVA